MDQIQTELGVTGAKRQSWYKANPCDILLKLVNQGYSEDEVRERCWNKVKDDQEMLRTIYEYWFRNNYRRLPGQHEYRARTDKQIAASAANLKRAVAARIEHEVKVRLLDLMMPTGKALRASNREELQATGGWAMRVADRLQPGQTVAEAGLTEEDLRTLYSS